MRLPGLVAAVMVVVALGAAHVALADRPPHADERGAILAGVGARSGPSCYTIRVSTVDASWASVTFAPAEPGESVDEYVDRCNPADGLTLVHRATSGWRRAWEGEGGAGAPFCPVMGVPTAVARDLAACRKRGRVLIARGTSYVYRPQSLIQGAHGTYVRLRWKGWGKPKATGVGLLKYSDRYDNFTARVRLRASHIELCLGHRVYMRLSTSGIRAVDRRRLGALAGTIDLACD